jgi:LacI family transcriptional regulator
LRAALQAQGYRTLLIPDSPEEPAHADLLSDGTLDGVLITTVTMGSQLPAGLKERGVPFGLVNRTTAAPDYDSCTVANELGAVTLADLVADLGHRRIGVILGPRDISGVIERETGLRNGFSARGIPMPTELVRRGAFSYENGRTAMLDLLGLKRPPTAVVCANDVIALGALNAAESAGVSVGKDVTVVGFDDIGMASWDLFQLTTMRSNLDEMARHSVRLLVQRIDDPHRDPQHVVIEPQLILRKSHGKAPEVPGD